MAGIILITGTDTGIGKTWVACALGRALTAMGRRVVAIKPVETGCDGTNPASEDGVLLARATGQPAPRHALRRFRTPVAPAAALDLEGGTLDFDELLVEIEGHAANADIVLLEGAGGLLAPITWDWNITDLAAPLGARALVVAADRLGTLNHTLLTIGALEFAGLSLLGTVLTPPATPDASTGSNADALARLAGTARVHGTPRTDDPLEAAAALRTVADWILDQPA